MKGVFLLLVVVTVAAVSAVPLKSEPDAEGWFVPSVNGSFHWQSKTQFEDEFKNIQARAVNVQYYLYTKLNPNSPTELFLDDANALASSNFNSLNPTRFIIHGWGNTYQSDVNVVVRDALMQSGTYNVICVDWSSSAANIYNSARAAVPSVGGDVANFIDFLNLNGQMSFSTLTLIGYDLGAHVSGYAGKRVQRGRVNAIVGLDPNLSLFSISDCSKRLCSTDASVVETIQTSAGILGLLEPIGSLAFYPNGGASQPGCGLDLLGSCAHSRSYIYYGEALVKNDFPSNECSSYLAAIAGTCANAYSGVKMGSEESYGSSGIYYVPVRNSPPYGMG